MFRRTALTLEAIFVYRTFSWVQEDDCNLGGGGGGHWVGDKSLYIATCDVDNYNDTMTWKHVGGPKKLICTYKFIRYVACKPAFPCVYIKKV